MRLTRVALRLLPDTCHALLAAGLRCADDQVPVHQRPLPRSPLQMGLKHTAPCTPLTDPRCPVTNRCVSHAPCIRSGLPCRVASAAIRREACAWCTGVNTLNRKRKVSGQAPRGVMINSSTAAPEQLLLMIRLVSPPPPACPGGSAACTCGCTGC